MSYKGFRFYQQDYGLTEGINPTIELQVQQDNADKAAELRLRMGEPVILSSGERLTVTDFIPTAVFHDGEIESVKQNAMLNPAYRVRLETNEGEVYEQWVLPAGAQLGYLRVLPLDFKGIEYTVLSMVRSPFDFLIYVGFVLAALGCLSLFRMFRNNQS